MKLYMDVGGTTICTELHTYDTIVHETFVCHDHKLYNLRGGIVSANPYLVEMVTEQIQAYALSEAAKRVTVVQTHLKDAPLEGAKYLEELL